MSISSSEDEMTSLLQTEENSPSRPPLWVWELKILHLKKYSNFFKVKVFTWKSSEQLDIKFKL